MQKTPSDFIGNEKTDDEEYNNETQPLENDKLNQSNIKEQDAKLEPSICEIYSSTESDTSYEVEESEIQLVSETKEDIQFELPITWGFIPSILTIIIMIGVYFLSKK